MSNSRKYQRYFKPISKEPFSTAGTNRSQGWVGQTSLSQSYARTPFIGTSPVGYGSRCGEFNTDVVFSCCSSSSSEGKSTKTTKGFLLSTVKNPTSVYNTSCEGNNACSRNIVKDFSPENNSQSNLLQRKKNKQMRQWPDLNGTAGKFYHCNSCSGATSYHIGGRLVTNEPYARRVAPMSSGEYLDTQYLYNHKTEDCCNSLAKSNPITTQPLILYYKLRTADGTTPFVDTLNFEVVDTSDEYRGITITSLANEAFVPIENTSVVFIGYRVPNTNTGNFVRKIYVEEFTITDAADHEFRAAKVYQDEGSEFETTLPSVKYNVVYASGKYKGRTAATIFFDKDGTKFGKGQTFARRIELE